MNTGGRGRYRTADRWCVKGRDRVNACSTVSSVSRSATFRVSLDIAVSTKLRPVLGHWRVTGEPVFGSQHGSVRPHSGHRAPLRVGGASLCACRRYAPTPSAVAPLVGGLHRDDPDLARRTEGAADRTSKTPQPVNH
ncbi:MAG: hypothetical protein QOK09_3102 [Mycobacterium sp.]|jgi:hypothetical protein|nr:hypothetical protein [Mycobacterium sp.]